MQVKYDDRALRVFADRTLPRAAEDAMRAAVEDERRRVLAEQSARSGGIAPALADMVVDGKRGASASMIGHNSRVLLDWNYLREAVERCLEHLRDKGPIRGGGWRRSLLVLVDGRETEPHAIRPGDERAIVAVSAPYGRRLEVGKDKNGGPFAVQVQQHFVERAMIQLRSRHADLARWGFNYVDLAGNFREHRPHHRAGRKRVLTDAQREQRAYENANVRYPAIVIDEIQAA